MLILRRSFCGGGWALGGDEPKRRLLGGARDGAGPGDFTRPCNRWGRRDVAAAGDTVGFGKVGTGGGLAQMCSPSSERGTGWLQFEHLTVGRSWEMRAGALAGAGERRGAIMAMVGYGNGSRSNDGLRW